MSKKDYVYTFGAGDSGQGGQGNLEHNLRPKEIFFNREIKEVKSLSCSWVNSAIVDSNGRLWCWGKNYEGMLSLLDLFQKEITSPTEIELFEEKASSVSLGRSRNKIYYLLFIIYYLFFKIFYFYLLLFYLFFCCLRYVGIN